MFCPQCGKEFTAKDAKYCISCGSDLSRIENVQSTDKGHILPVKQLWLRTLNKTQIIILSFGALWTVLLLIYAIFAPGTSWSMILFVLSVSLAVIILWAYKVNTWGWGWYLILGFSYLSLHKTYAQYGAYEGFITLASIPSALFVYFLLRNKSFMWLKLHWHRSLISAIIALFAAGFVAAFTSHFVPTRDHRIWQKILEESDLMKAQTKTFTEQNAKLWSNFISEPRTLNDYENNHKIVELSIPLYSHKDSVLLTVLNRIIVEIESIYKETDPPSWSLSFSPQDFNKLIDKAKDIDKYDDLMLNNLSSYYNCLISSGNNCDGYWSEYAKARQGLEIVSQDYASFFKQYFNYDLSNSTTNNK